MVGYVKVPDERYGKGGSYGDLPRDFEVFNRDVSVDIDIHPDHQENSDYQDGETKTGPLGVKGNYYDDQYKQNGLKYHDQVLANNRKTVGTRNVSGPRMGLSMNLRQANKYKLDSENMMNDDTGVENCAPVEDPMIQGLKSESECLSCDKQDNRPIYHGDLTQDDGLLPDNTMDQGQDQGLDQDQEQDQDYDQDYDDIPEGDHESETMNHKIKYLVNQKQGNGNSGKYMYYDDVNRKNQLGYDKTYTNSYENHDADESYDSIYKYLFFILLIIIIFLIYNYKHNGGKFNFDFMKKQ